MIREEDDRFSVPALQPRRLGRRTAIGWVILALVVVGAIAALLVWVAHRLSQVAA
jgi:ferric-dicitrate binding protein FerR (iron transport regulator)